MTDPQIWTDVEDYFTALLAPPDDALTAALRDSDAAGLPPINVAPSQGKLLHFLAVIQGASRILEIGTLGGYSTIWLARALPADGRLISLEYDPRHAEVATRNIARAGLDKQVEVRVGAALETLPQLADENPAPFDLVFIDADKVHTPDYFAWALEHTRPGGIIVTDNVVRDGTLADAESGDATIEAQRRFHEALAADPRVEATTIQTVGAKGYDGFTVALVGS
jgi:predicted O-methyltransferase YrrM